MNRRDAGALGERIAAKHLAGLGYVILERNFRAKEGEIDIVAEKDDYLVFVEVRTKSSTEFGSPEESVTSAKKEKLIASSFAYLNSHRNPSPSWRIDFVAVELDQKGKTTRIELIENAIS